MSTQEFPRTWWKEAVIYQIYPSSFLDSNGDGIGDLNGIYSKLDYLKDLGVDVLWLCPIYRSPQADMGYDIADYRDIDPRYGTLADWDNLLKGIHDRGMKLMMDLVVNHTSDEHDWFTQSSSGKANPKRDWYIWRPPKYDADGNRQPPNNWKSVFQGSAWKYDAPSDEYYLHLYVEKQPDLNWDNPTVRDAVWDLMRFWLDRGCDGFRMDVINLISKADGLPDAPIAYPKDRYQPGSIFFANGPRVHEYVQEMNKKVLSNYDIVTVGETPFTHSSSELAKYVLPGNKELNMVFQFELMDIDSPAGSERSPLIPTPWELSSLKEIVGKWQRFKRDEGFWNAIFIENHDHARSVSRFGNDGPNWRSLSAKMLALLQIAQGGTQYVYQGEEIGLKNFPRSWGIEEYKDVASQNYWNQELERRRAESGKQEVDMSDVLDGFQRKARDHSRTPMQWDATHHAGFTTGAPWMRVNDDYESWNAAAQINDPDSIRSFWKLALKTRKAYDVLIYGDFLDLCPENEQLFAIRRTSPSSTALILLNFKGIPLAYHIDERIERDGFKLVLGNYASEASGLDTEVLLNGFEGRIYIKGTGL